MDLPYVDHVREGDADGAGVCDEVAREADVPRVYVHPPLFLFLFVRFCLVRFNLRGFILIRFEIFEFGLV